MEQGIQRSQRDYSLAFKVSVIDQVAKGELTYRQTQARYGGKKKNSVNRRALS